MCALVCLSLVACEGKSTSANTEETISGRVVPVTAASSGDNSMFVDRTPEIAQLGGRDVQCMAQESGSGTQVIDCNWREYYANPHYIAPAGLLRLQLSEQDEPYGNGKLRCLTYPLSAGDMGETCDWADPAIQNKVPDMSQPKQAALYQVMTYKGHDRNCVVKDTYPDFHEYSCDLDKDYKAPPTERHIPAGNLTALSGIPWQNGTVSGFEFQQDYDLLCATIDWATLTKPAVHAQ